MPIGPVVAPAGTVTSISVFEIRLKSGAGTLLNATTNTSCRVVPLIVTTVPTTPDTGVKPVIVGST